jgi:hypothetical protein
MTDDVDNDLRDDRQAGKENQSEPDAPNPDQPLASPADESSGSGGIPFMITAAQKAALAALGWTAEAIAKMKPATAHEVIASGLTAAAVAKTKPPPPPTFPDPNFPTSDDDEVDPDQLYRDDLDKLRKYAGLQFKREIPAARRTLAAARKAIKHAQAEGDFNRRDMLRRQALPVGFNVVGGGLQWEVGFNGLREAALKWPDRDPETESDAKIDNIISFAFFEAFKALTDSARKRRQKRPSIDLDDFVAYLPNHTFICRKTRAFWSREGVNAAFPDAVIPASEQIEHAEPTHCLSWLPGEREIVRDTVVMAGGRVAAANYRTYNLYMPPTLKPVEGDASPWLDHFKRIYPDNWGHIVDCFASKVQHPALKINHSLVLGGLPGIGKDTLLEPPRRAVGTWNFAEVTPNRILDGKFNGYRQSVILRISEAKDLGDYDRYNFAEATKILIAAPPDTLEVNDKYREMIYVPNVVLVVITTNHRVGAVHLTRDDRRHYVCWSEAKKEDFDEAYWKKIWGWYEKENGFAIVADFLLKRDLSRFDPKAPPKLTPAFWAMVDAEVAVETTELAALIDGLGVRQADGEIERPKAVTVSMILSSMIKAGATGSFKSGCATEKTVAAFRISSSNADTLFRNDADKRDGIWVIDGKRQVVYVQRELTNQEAHNAINELKTVEQRAKNKAREGVADINKYREEKAAQAHEPQSRNDEPSTKAISVSRPTLRRITTAPDVFSPTTLQTFLPRSTPRTAISIPFPPSEPPATLRRRKEGRAIP